MAGTVGPARRRRLVRPFRTDLYWSGWPKVQIALPLLAGVISTVTWGLAHRSGIRYRESSSRDRSQHTQMITRVRRCGLALVFAAESLR